MAENGKISEGQAQKRTSPRKAYIRDKQTVEGGFQRSAHSIPLGELPLDRIRFTLLHPLRLLLVVFRGFLHAPQFLLQYRQLSLLPALNLLEKELDPRRAISAQHCETCFKRDFEWNC